MNKATLSCNSKSPLSEVSREGPHPWNTNLVITPLISLAYQERFSKKNLLPEGGDLCA